MKTKKEEHQRRGKKEISLSAGFEPTRAEHIGFQVQRLNHSAKIAFRKGQMHEIFAYM
jgi:hypothetical protein